MIYLHKILPLLLLPVGVTLLLVLAGLRLRRRALIWSGLGILWLGSTPVVAGLAVRVSEGWAVRGPKVGKAPLLVFTGGAAPSEPNAALEGDLLAGYARQMGVPEGQIAKTPRSCTI